MPRFAGIVLCGGKSSRMGLSKADLPFGPETMLARVVRLLSTVVQPIVVVAAAGQTLPSLPGDVLATADSLAERGPLQGLLAGMSALPAGIDAVYATSCDVPFLVPAWVQHLLSQVEEVDCVVPVEGRFAHPLAAVYRPRIEPAITALLAADQLRPAFLFERVPTRRIAVEELRAVDPQLQTLRNLNHPNDYLQALADAGFDCPADIRAQLDAASRHF